MSQLLIVSPCPNCGTDASNHNKVLYDGIFLICHNCGYGWYYNIKVINSEELTPYNSKSAPLNTIHNIKKVYNINKHKRNLPSNKKNRTPINHKKNSFDNHNNYNQNANYENNFSNKLPSQNNIPAKPISYNAGKYTSNVYYSPTVIHKEASDTRYSKNENHSNSSVPSNKFIQQTNSKQNYLNNAYESNKNTDNPLAHKEPKQTTNLLKNTHINKVINLNNDINHKKTSSNNIVINFNKLPHKKAFRDNVKNNYNSASNSTNPNNTNNNKHISNSESISHDLKKSDSINNKSNINNYENIKLNKNESSPKKENSPSDIDIVDLPSNKRKNYVKLNNNKNTFPDISKPHINDPSINEHNTNNILGNSSISLKNLQLSNDISAIKNTEYIKAVEDFNSSLVNKKNLGFEANSLLNLEEKSKYNINEFNRNSFKISSFIPELKTIQNSIKAASILTIKNLILLFTRLDLLLRFLAYMIIVGGSIGFLAYLNHKKHTKINQSDITNAPYNINLSTEINNNLSFADNTNLNAVTPLEQNKSNLPPKLNHTTITNDQDSILAFETQLSGKDHMNHTNTNHQPLSNMTTNINKQSSSILDKIKTTLNNGALTFKQIQKNSFSKVKVFQKNIKWQGDYNKTLISSTTLSNNDKSNSYLIKSLEVVFLGDKGNTIGKRVIITNQLINNNSAIELSLKINNPPSGTNNIFVFIKDKTKL